MRTVERLEYLNRFRSYGNNDIIQAKADYLIDYVLRTDLHTANIQLCKLRQVHHYNNYMFLLESICNYIVYVYNRVKFDYERRREYGNIDTLEALKSRYNNVRKIYDYFLEQEAVNYKQQEKGRKCC